MLKLLWIGLVVLLGLWACLYPYFQKQMQGLFLFEELNKPNELERLKSEKANLILVLKELDFDFETGKLSGEDYKELRAKYENETVRVMKSLDQIESEWKTIGTEIDRSLA